MKQALILTATRYFILTLFICSCRSNANDHNSMNDEISKYLRTQLKETEYIPLKFSVPETLYINQRMAGWKIIHSYRAKTGDGIMVPHSDTFYFDNNHQLMNKDSLDLH